MLFAALFVVNDEGSRGGLSNHFLRETVFPRLRSLQGKFTDFKFQRRGPRAPKHKVVVVDIDDYTIEQTKSRWPWHRDMLAYLIDQTFKSGAKAVGLDIVLAEPDKRIWGDLEEFLKANKLEAMITKLETDNAFLGPLMDYGDRLVLGWASESLCRPLFDVVPAKLNQADDPCPVTNAELLATHPKEMAKFAFQKFSMSGEAFQPLQTPIYTAAGITANLEEYNTIAAHAGFFNSWADSDGVIRRVGLLMMANGRAYPSLPLEMARVALGEELSVKFGADHRIEEVAFAKSGRQIASSPLGAMNVNFRGGERTFTYVRAIDVMSDGAQAAPGAPPAGAPANAALPALKEKLKDAYVFIGLSAMGAADFRAFPFDEHVPGVEGHANVLDNLLAGDPLRPSFGPGDRWLILLVMILGGLVFCYFAQKLEAVPALLAFLAVFAGLGIVDIQVFTHFNVDWNSSLLCIELSAIFAVTLAAKYVDEERNKKFIRGAFSKYVAPAIVDEIIKDPTRLTVGGERRDLTILFSDIRGFTTFSEKMDAKQLSAFLNDYLNIMTEIVFAHDGTLDKYIGDAVMAFWGAPIGLPAHAAKAAQAAVAMMKALHENQARFKAQYGIDVDIGVGINTGNVSVGNMGSERNFSYTVIGDHVNLASRLEGLTKAYAASVLTTRYTMDGIAAAGGALPPHRVLDFVMVKGKKQAVELIQLLDREYGAEGLQAFADARALYVAQKWDEAIAKFREAAQLLLVADRPDGACDVFIERCEQFKLEGPGEDWSGAWKMETK